ncbi:MAG: potassium-transporting ATPase subunit C [Candidatus Fermentibacterota bacterium]
MDENGRKEDVEEMMSEESAAEEAREIPVPRPESWWRRISTSLRLLLVFVLLCSVAYPGLLLLVGELLWAEEVRGGIVYIDGAPAGARLIGQPFGSDTFFHPRPSFRGYDGMNSGSQNLGPYNPALTERVASRLGELEARGVAVEDVPVGWVTESGSGLDPHITPGAARLQVPRVSRATGIPEEELEGMIREREEGRFAGIFGQERVNVLLLNIAVRQRLEEP